MKYVKSQHDVGVLGFFVVDIFKIYISGFFFPVQMSPVIGYVGY